MIKIEKLRDILASYKKDFSLHWEEEKYKWEAIQHFQSNWDVEAGDFASMLEMATKKTGNLLNSKYYFPGA